MKLVNFVVECFFDIWEGRYYMFASIEAFHDGSEREGKDGRLLAWISESLTDTC